MLLVVVILGVLIMIIIIIIMKIMILYQIGCAASPLVLGIYGMEGVRSGDDD